MIAAGNFRCDGFGQRDSVVPEAKRVGDKILITLPNAGKPNYDKSLVETSEHLWFPTEEIVLKLVGQGKIEYTSEKDFILVQAT